MKLFRKTLSILLAVMLAALFLQVPINTHASAVHNSVHILMDLESIAFTKDSLEKDAGRRIRYGAELTEDDLRIDISNSGLNYLTSSGHMYGVGSGEQLLQSSRSYYACYAILPGQNTSSGGSIWPESIASLEFNNGIKPISNFSDFTVYVNNSVRNNVYVQHLSGNDGLFVYIPMNVIAVGTWNLSSATVPPPKDVIYSGYSYEPSYQTITCNGRTLKQYLHYTYEYENNLLPGRAIVRIVGYGKYTGSVTRFFTIHFTDVPPTHPYKSAVNWAAAEKIATGYTGDLTGIFGVGDKITRGQVAMMLWRAGGKQEPSGNTQVFKDVPVKHKFYKAVQWAYEQGITGGYTGDRAGYFGVNDNCTRGQIMTFIWRFEGKPEPAGTTKTFTDVPVKHNFYKAIQWAYEEEITAGYSDGSFGVNKNCTRGHCVTFLYKDRVKG